MARVLERLEIRSGPTGSTDTSVIDIIPDVISSVTSQEVNGRETYRVGLPVLSTAWSSLVERQVLKNIMNDGTVDSEWRIMSLKSRRQPGQLNGIIECESIKYDLSNTLVSRTESNGDVNNYFELYGLTPTQHLGVILADAPSHFSVGTIASSAPLDMVYDWDNALSAASEVALLANLELSVDLTSTGYKVNMPVSIGSTASKTYIRYSRNLAGLSRDSDARTNQGTRVYPRGGGAVGDRLKIAEAAWVVASFTTVTATLSTAEGRAIEFDNQLNGLWIEETGGVRKLITDSTTGQVITMTGFPPIHAISTGERVKFRTSSGGAQLTYLEDPAQVATYGTVQRVFDRQDIPPIDNFVENPFFTGTYTAGVPTNWSKVGALTFTESTSEAFRKFGNKSLHITSTAAGRGVISDSIAITPTSASPYLTGQTAIWVVSGAVELQLIDQSSTVDNVFPPPDAQPAKTTVVGQWVDKLGVSGIDFNDISSTAVKLQVLAHGGAAEWYIDAAQVTQTASVLEAFNNGRASNQLWIAGNGFLTDNAAPRVTFGVQVDDLERLHPAEFSNAKLVVGGPVQVVDADMGLDFQTRVINLNRDLLHPGASQVTLSNRPEDLSGLGIPGRRAKALRPPQVDGFFAEVTGIEVTFDEEADAVVSASAGEDTANIYVTVGDGSAPSDPTVATNDGVIVGRTGSVDTGVKVTTGNDAFVKAIAADAAGNLGPIATTKHRRDLGPFHKDTSARSHTGDTNETTLETITIPANSLGTEGGVRVTADVSKTGTGGIVTLRWKWGGTLFHTDSFANHDALLAHYEFVLSNDGATNSQVMFGRTLRPGHAANEISIISAADTKDTTSSQDLIITVQLVNTGDTITLDFTLVEYIGRN